MDCRVRKYAAAKPMTLKQRIHDDMKTAMRGGDKSRLMVIRMTMAAIKQREVDGRKDASKEVDLGDQQVLEVIEKMVKQRRESVTQYEAGGRKDLAEKEAAEIDMLKDYLPEQMSEQELDAIVAAVIAETGASGMQDMGKVMGQLKQKAQGRADMSQVSQKVKAHLS